MGEQRFLVTGAHGFIGAWVVKQLLAENTEVVIFDRSPDARRLRLIMEEEEMADAKFVAGDITEADSIARAIQHHAITHIIHLAALQVPACRADPVAGAMVNVVGTINLFEAARRSEGRVQKIVYASSAAVFGRTEDDRPLRENEAANPTTHYGAFKRCNEDNARIYFWDDGLSSIGLRPLTVYGVGRDFGLTSDPTKAMKAAVAGRPFHIRFGGETDFLYVADAAEAFIRAARSNLLGAYVFNLHGETAHVAEIVAEIERLCPEAKGTITYAETPLPIPPQLDDTAIRSALQLPPVTPLARGMRETIERFARLQSEGRLDLSDLDI